MVCVLSICGVCIECMRRVYAACVLSVCSVCIECMRCVY